MHTETTEQHPRSMPQVGATRTSSNRSVPRGSAGLRDRVDRNRTARHGRRLLRDLRHWRATRPRPDGAARRTQRSGLADTPLGVVPRRRTVRDHGDGRLHRALRAVGGHPPRARRGDRADVPIHAAALVRNQQGRGAVRPIACRQEHPGCLAHVPRLGVPHRRGRAARHQRAGDHGRPAVLAAGRGTSRRPGRRARRRRPARGTEVLVPASRLGSLGEPAPLVAIVCPRYSRGRRRIDPALAGRGTHDRRRAAPEPGPRRRSVFHALADIVTRIPSYALGVDDLDTAEATLAR